jgi:hypothetical protein
MQSNFFLLCLKMDKGSPELKDKMTSLFLEKYYCKFIVLEEWNLKEWGWSDQELWPIRMGHPKGEEQIIRKITDGQNT